ncbi:MAG: amidohydrolase [Pseudomonadota bacterium]
MHQLFTWLLIAVVTGSAWPLATLAIDYTAAQQTALGEAPKIEPDITDLAMQIWGFAEIALTEKKSAQLLSSFLETEGFSVERGVAGIPTAFVAEFGSGKPVIGVLAEFDALPELGNLPVPRQTPRADGYPHGHGCGHNVFGAGSTGTAVLIKRAIEKHGLEGTVRLYGTPAEETLVGKVYMARAGLFDDLDMALDWHPSLRNKVRNQRGQAMNNFKVEFFGKSAHGAYDPWNGRSAMDALEMFNFGINLMREHIEPTARIHYAVEAGGEVPNVVPNYARGWYYVRDNDRAKVEAHFAWLRDIAKGAALATQTEHKVDLITGVHETLLNRPLQEAVQSYFEAVGSPEYSLEDQAFARDLQRNLGREETGITTEIKPLEAEPQPTRGGSTDVAEVSRITPTVSIAVATAAEKIPWHSWAVTATHGRPSAAKGAHIAMRVLALTGLAAIEDEKLLAKAKRFHAEATGGTPYQSPIPADRALPKP